MAKEIWKPGNMLYPLPVVMVSLADRDGRANIITVAWAGTVCTNPPMLSVSIRPERYSYPILKETGEFVVNLTTKALAYAADYCGVKSGRDVDKFRDMHLSAVPGTKVKAPLIAESPVNIECVVREVKPLGSHDLFLADVAAVHADEKYMDENHRFHLELAEPIVYSHGAYFLCGEQVGTFGYSVRKPAKHKAQAGSKANGKDTRKAQAESKANGKDTRKAQAREGDGKH